MRSRRALSVAVTMIPLLCAAAEAAVTKSVADIPTRFGTTQRILHFTPPFPAAHVVILTGLDGYVGIQSDGTIANEYLSSLLGRNAPRWGAQGMSFTVVDVPSDRSSMDVGFRKSPLRVADILGVAHYLRQKAAVPVWLVGTGSGAVDAITVATSSTLDVPLGLVLSPHTAGPASVFDLDLASVRQPTLVVGAADDTCSVSPGQSVPFVVTTLAKAPVKEYILMVGGVPQHDPPCDDTGPHGFEGLDTLVVGAIGAWISQYNSMIGGAPSAVALAVEFYNVHLDHYFVSSLLPDILAVGTGRFAGWSPTLETLPVAVAHRGDTQPVCRFYIPPAFGDSHFYSASPVECMETAAKFPQLELESSNVFEIGLPDPATGACPAGTAPVYRIWNNRADSNHRYTTRTAIRDQMAAKGGIVEGYGQPPVAMCSPL